MRFFNYKFDPNSCKVVLPRHLTRASPHATWFLREASQSRQLRRNCQLCGSHYHSCSASSVCVCLIGASLASLQVFGIFSPDPLVTQRLGHSPRGQREHSQCRKCSPILEDVKIPQIRGLRVGQQRRWCDCVDVSASLWQCVAFWWISLYVLKPSDPAWPVLDHCCCKNASLHSPQRQPGPVFFQSLTFTGWTILPSYISVAISTLLYIFYCTKILKQMYLFLSQKTWKLFSCKHISSELDT